MSDMRLVVVGAAGRMGLALVGVIAGMPGVTLVGAVEREDSPVIGGDVGRLAGLEPLGVEITSDPLPLFATAEGVLDFTTPAATLRYAELAAQARIVHVIGTTGLGADDEERIVACARHSPIVKSGNMSLGINLLLALVGRAARALAEDFDIEIVEMHHRNKVDAPSGTALMLGEAAAAGRDIDLSARAVMCREGHTGARTVGDIGFATLRGGSVVGEHTVIFAGDDERIELTHRAQDRSIFARGAVKAALWARGRKPGIYTMADVIGLSGI